MNLLHEKKDLIMKNRIIALCLVVFLFLSSFAVDLLFKRFQNLFNILVPMIPFGTELAAYIILSILLLYAAWLILYRNPPSKVMAFVSIILGAFFLFTMSVAGNIFWSHYSPSLINDWFSAYTDIATSRYGFSRIVSSMILVIGLLRLFPEKKLWPTLDKK
jgi:hypothetical protein